MQTIPSLCRANRSHEPGLLRIKGCRLFFCGGEN
jgi:hypothetical protein